MKKLLFCSLLIGCLSLYGWASDFAPAIPDLDLPADLSAAEEPAAEPVQEVAPAKKAVHSKTISSSKGKSSANRAKAAKPDDDAPVISVDNKMLANDTQVEAVVIDPEMLKPISQEVVLPEEPAAEKPAEVVTARNENSDSFVAAREEGNAGEEPTETKVAKVVYNPPTDRDPTLSPDDTLLLKHREEERLKAIEAERQRKIEAERQRLAELERQRQLELERLRDPSREVRGKIHISGIIGQEVFIGDKVYTVGKSILGARIVSVQPDSVVFIYKGQKFTKKVQLQ